MHQVIIETHGKRISVRVPFELKDLAKALPGYKWNKVDKTWDFTASPRIAALIQDKFSFCTILADDGFAQLVASSIGSLNTHGLSSQLWEHQQQAAQFILNRNNIGMLNMDMGTGKSLTSIALANTLRPDNLLILCPHAVCRVWEDEIITHAPGIFYPIILDKGSVAERTQRARDGVEIARHHKLIPVIVVNYDIVWREPLRSWIKLNISDMEIYDESHRLKSAGGRISTFCKNMCDRVAVRIAQTGTPMPNTREDIYAQARAIDPTVFGISKTLFNARFAVVKKNEAGFAQIVDWKNTDEFRELFHDFAITIGDEVLDLPPLTISFRHCELGKEARKVYTNLEELYYSEIELIEGIIEGEIAAPNALVKLLRLQQVTSGVIETEEGKEVRIDTSKASLLGDSVNDVKSDEPVVVFCRFRKDLEVCRAVAAELGRTYGEVSGRQKDLEGGKMPEGIDLMGVQMQAGSAGINLTRAAYGFIMSQGFSLGDYKQCIKRLHRPGQTRAVHITHLVASNTIDEIVYRSIKRKEADIAEVLRKDD